MHKFSFFADLDLQLQLVLKPYLHILTEIYMQSGLRNCDAFTYKYNFELISGMK